MKVLSLDKNYFSNIYNKSYNTTVMAFYVPHKIQTLYISQKFVCIISGLTAFVFIICEGIVPI